MNIVSLLDYYELSTIMHNDTYYTAILIYNALIESGMLPEEIMDENILADNLLIDVKYEFCIEEILENLTDELFLIGLADSVL